MILSYTLEEHFNKPSENNYHVIPFGYRCTSAIACKIANLRKCSLPFDWTGCWPSAIREVLQNDFQDFLPDVYNNQFINKYNIHFVHFNTDIAQGIEDTNRRITRFYNIIYDDKEKYFICMNEDYIYNEWYRKTETTYDFFVQLCELDSLLKTKFPNMKYKILYFDFVKHALPPDSNIIQVTIHSTEYYTTSKNEDKIRTYYGRVLKKLFGTKMISSYNHDNHDFNN